MQSNSIDYIHDLITQYSKKPSIDLLVKFHSYLNKLSETTELEEYFNKKIDSNIYRILATYCQKKLSISNVVSNSILIRGLQTKIDFTDKGDDLGNSALDYILFSKFDSLTDKIILFENTCKANEKNCKNALRYALVISYTIDKDFYNHLESLILQLDDIQYFPQKYSFNPYIGNDDLLNDALSHLFNITIKININETKLLLSKYSSITKYKYINTENGIIHSIFYLIENKMWEDLGKWIQNEPNTLMLSDKNSISLISRILILSHGYIKNGAEHDKWFDLQKKVIDIYYRAQLKLISPQVDLFLAYLENERNFQFNRDGFLKTTQIYYKYILEYFIEVDHKNANAFLSSRCPNKISLYTLLLNSGYKIEVGNESKIGTNTIFVYHEQLSNLSEVIQIDELYFSIFQDKKISIHANNILDELKRNILSLSGRRCQKLFSIMIHDYLNLKYAEDFIGKFVIQNKIQNILILISKYLNFSEFIEKDPNSFEILCKMAEYEIIKEFKVSHSKEQTISIILENAINALWFSNSDKSDVNNAEKFCLTAIHLNMIISTIIPEEKIVKLFLKNNKVQQQIDYYLHLDIHECNTNLCSELKIHFKNEGFRITGQSTKENYIRLYNFTSILFAKLFNWIEISNDTLNITYREEKHIRRTSLFKSVYDLIISDNHNTVLQRKTNLDNIEQAIHIFLIHLSDFKQHTSDLKQEELHNLFIILLKASPDHKIIHDAHNPTSELWSQIRMTGSTRSKDLFDFFLHNRGKTLNETRKHHIQCSVNRAIRHSIIVGDLQGVENWLQYGINILENTTPTKVTSLKNIPDNTELVLTSNDISPVSGSSSSLEKSFSVSSDSNNKLRKSSTFDGIKLPICEVKDLLNNDQIKLVHNALITSISAANFNSVNLILSQFPAFFINYKLDKEMNIFSIIREHIRSNMMELPTFSEALNKITIILLEHGYSIDLIEMHNGKNCRSFITSILTDQIKYSAIQTAINWCGNIPILPNIAQGVVAARYYMNIYEKSLDYLLHSSERKIDISAFCNVFSSIFQPVDFISRVKNISFFYGVKDSFTEQELKKSAAITLKVIQNISDSKRRLSSEIKSRELFSIYIKDAILSQPFLEEKHIQNDIPYKKEDYTKEDFLIFRYKTLTQHLNQITSIETLKENTLIQKIGALFVTGTFCYINNECSIRNTVNALLPVIPTVAHGTAMAGFTLFDGIKNLLNMISPISGYLIAFGTTAYVAYDIYKQYSEQKSVMFDIDTIKKLSTKFYQSKPKIYSNFSENDVYNFMRSLFKNYTNKEFISQDAFFNLMRRFGITSGDLFTEIENLKNINENTSFFVIADSITLVSAYLNAIQIKNIIPTNEQHKVVLIEILQHFMSKEVKQLKICMITHNIGDLYKNLYETLQGFELLMNHYNIKNHDQYIWTLKNSHLMDAETKEKLMKDSFFKFIFTLSELSTQNCDKSKNTIETSSKAIL